MLLTDFVTLVRTVPEESKKYGARTCVAGISEDLGGLTRIYPVLLDAPLRARHRAELDVRKNDGDNRRESFKLIDAVDSVRSVSEKPVIETAGIFDQAEKVGTFDIGALNERRMSLGFVRPKSVPVVRLKARSELQDPRQHQLFDEFVSDLREHEFRFGNGHPLVPYVDFFDAAGKHSLQLREWGAFEYLRKYPDNPAGLTEHFRRKGPREYLLLIGNQMHNRTSWMVLNLWSRERTGQVALFGEEAA